MIDKNNNCNYNGYKQGLFCFIVSPFVKGGYLSEVKNKGKTFKKSDSTNVYMHKGCEYRVKREFEESGVTILDQVISVLLDIENETNQVKEGNI